MSPSVDYKRALELSPDDVTMQDSYRKLSNKLRTNLLNIELFTDTRASPNHYVIIYFQYYVTRYQYIINWIFHTH